MIRVLNFINLECGGAETTVMNYYRHIDRTKIQFDFLVAEKENQYFEAEAKSLGANIYRRPMRTKKPIENAKILYNILKNNPEIKIVHLHGYITYSLVIDTILTMLFGISARIVHSRCELVNERLLHKLFKPLLRITATHLVSCSKEAGISLFGRAALNKKKYFLFHNARNLQPFTYNHVTRDTYRKKMSLNKKYVILTVGRLMDQKNHMFILDALYSAHQEQPDIMLLIAGEGELREQLSEKITSLNIKESVRLLGLRDDIPDLLQAADLFVLPSLFEGLPGAAIEAQAAGLPCLISDTVTKECKVTDAVEFLPIDKGPEIWAERMLAYRNFERRDTYDVVRKAGYDIKDASKKLEEFYLGKH